MSIWMPLSEGRFGLSDNRTLSYPALGNLNTVVLNTVLPYRIHHRVFFLVQVQVSPFHSEGNWLGVRERTRNVSGG